jgi:hypothetical protein
MPDGQRTHYVWTNADMKKVWSYQGSAMTITDLVQKSQTCNIVKAEPSQCCMFVILAQESVQPQSEVVLPGLVHTDQNGFLLLSYGI